MSQDKQVFTVELNSKKPSGLIKDSASGLEAQFNNTGELAHFLKANYKGSEEAAENTEQCQCEETSKEEQKKEELPKKKDIVMPERKNIATELKKVSNFNDEELSIMGWSSMYKAYSLIMRYGQKGVEDQFRNNDWWSKEMKKLAAAKKKEKPEEKDKDKDSKKEARKQKKLAKKAKKVERKTKKVERKSKKKEKK